MVAFVVVKEEILPLPEAFKPILGIELVQAYVVPATPKLLEKSIEEVVEPTQYASDDMASTVGVGLTVIVKDSLFPVHVVVPWVKLGVTCTTATTGVELIFVALNEAILPVDDAAKLIEGVVFVQEYVVPVIAPVKLTAATEALLHTTRLEGSTTVGVGITLILNVTGFPTHSSNKLVYFGVTLKFPVCTELVELTVLKAEILPVLEACIPIEVFVLVHS